MQQYSTQAHNTAKHKHNNPEKSKDKVHEEIIKNKTPPKSVQQSSTQL